MVASETWYPGEGGRSGGALSAVSWAAVLAGGAAAAALSLILLLLGVGLGLSATSPWAGDGAGAAALGIGAVVWLAFTQLAASGLGGYLAGRLRLRWRDVHADEVHFRDTAQGLVTWAVATLFTAAVLTSSIGAVVGIGAQTAAAVGTGVAAVGAAGATAAAKSTSDSEPMGSSDLSYFVDTLMRPSATGSAAAASAPAASGANSATLRNWPDASMVQANANSSAELSRLMVRALRNGGTLTAEDTRYAGQLVAQRTGLAQGEAERRVTETLQRARAEVQAAETKAREAADAARKAALHTALWMFVALLIGAFTASWMATVGGRQRDTQD